MNTVTFRDTDIPALIAACGGAPCKVNGVDGVGILDVNDQIIVQDATLGQVSIPCRSLTVQTSAFPDLDADDDSVIGMPIEVDGGKQFTIRERIRYGDSGAQKLLLGTGPERPPKPPAIPPRIDGGFFDGSGGVGPSVTGGGFAP